MSSPPKKKDTRRVFPLAAIDRERIPEIPEERRPRDLRAAGEGPPPLAVSRSDCRIVPRAIFSAETGEPFLLRNVMNICRLEAPSVARAIGYAVTPLKIGSRVVLAHSDCGALKASGIRQFERVAAHPSVKAAMQESNLEVGLFFSPWPVKTAGTGGKICRSGETVNLSPKDKRSRNVPLLFFPSYSSVTVNFSTKRSGR